ncbi:reverse transcriptase domain-containing protein [Tanacetum coccineum]
MDGGSSLKVMYEHCFRNLGSDTKARLKESRVPLVGFSGEVNYPLGVIDLNVTMGELDKLRTVMMEFAVVKCHSPYNVILGRTGMRSLGALASTMHAMIKFPMANRIATMVTKGETLQECQSIKEAEGPTPKPPEKVTVKDNHPDQPITIEGNLSAKCRAVRVLRKHDNAFAWRNRSIAPDRRKVVKEEVEVWLKSGIVKRVRYPTWVANPVLVKKADGSWRMCIDFKDLNKACPKDLLKNAVPPIRAMKEAFQTMKRLIVELPTLTSPMKGEDLMVYLSTTNEAVSAILLVERRGRQMPIHYVSRSLQGAEGQVLADFLADTMAGDDPMSKGTPSSKKFLKPNKDPESLRSKEEQMAIDPIEEADTWKLYTDGASNDHGSGAGLILIDSEGMEYSYAI